MPDSFQLPHTLSPAVCLGLEARPIKEPFRGEWRGLFEGPEDNEMGSVSSGFN